MPTDPRSLRQLCIRARQGSLAARDQLLKTHLGLVIHIARYFYRDGAFLEMADLIQQGCLGLLRAIDKFDPFKIARGRPVQFATYAHFWITHSIRREIQNHGRTIAVPVHRCKEPQPDLLPLDPGNWLEDDNGHAFARTLDLEAPDDRWAEVWEARRVVEGLLQKLSPQTQATMRCRYGLAGEPDAMTQQQTAKKLGLSNTHVSQLERTGVALMTQLAKTYLV